MAVFNSMVLRKQHYIALPALPRHYLYPFHQQKKTAIKAPDTAAILANDIRPADEEQRNDAVDMLEHQQKKRYFMSLNHNKYIKPSQK